MSALPIPALEASAEYQDLVEAWALVKRSLFVLGDAGIAFSAAYSRKTLLAVCEEQGMSRRTIDTAMWLARTYKPEQRIEGLSVRHHQVAAGCEPAKRSAVLAEAKAKRWSSKRLAQELKLAPGVGSVQERVLHLINKRLGELLRRRKHTQVEAMTRDLKAILEKYR